MAAWALGLPPAARPQQQVAVPAQDGAGGLVQLVRAAVTSYTLALEQLGVTRRHPIKIKLSNNAADYRTRSNGYLTRYTDREARWPNGLAYMDQDTLMIKALPPYDQAELQHRVWHAMTHALQVDLSNGGSARARPWLSEGMADLFAFLAAGKADPASVAEWEASLRRRLAQAPATAAAPPLTPAALLDIDADDWDALSEASQGANYALADLMLLRFYATRGAQAVPQLAAYYRCLVQGFVAEKTCFADSLGMQPGEFALPQQLAAR